MELLGLAIGAIFVQNVILSQFLGICSFLGVSKKMSNVWGMSAAVMFVMMIIMFGVVLNEVGLAKRLEEEGVFVNPVVSPACPAGRSLIRTSYMATHRREHLTRALEAFQKVGRELGLVS